MRTIVSLDSYLKVIARENEIPRLLASRCSSAKVLMTEPDIDHAVKEILGHESSTSSPCFTLHVEFA